MSRNGLDRRASGSVASRSRYTLYRQFVPPRRYVLKDRARRQRETRQRIVDAAIDLHQTIGPARTSFGDVAERAGVGRVTVYRHFADEPALAAACSGHYFATHPMPDPALWRAIADPTERLRTGVRETLEWWGANARMMRHVLADARDHPVMAPFHRHWDAAVEALCDASRAPGRGRERRRAAVALALSFETWRTLVEEGGLSVDEACAFLAGAVTRA